MGSFTLVLVLSYNREGSNNVNTSVIDSTLLLQETVY